MQCQVIDKGQSCRGLVQCIVKRGEEFAPNNPGQNTNREDVMLPAISVRQTYPQSLPRDVTMLIAQHSEGQLEQLQGATQQVQHLTALASQCLAASQQQKTSSEENQA